MTLIVMLTSCVTLPLVPMIRNTCGPNGTLELALIVITMPLAVVAGTANVI